MKKQFVCTACGFNMIGYNPEYCPFCGAPRSVFLTSEECSDKFSVKSSKVSDKVARLNSVPKLGLEHSAYRIETDGRAWWIDSPSCFDKDLPPVDVITFTHHHFLGASNQYRELFSSKVMINRLDSEHKISRAFTFDSLTEGDFVEDSIEAFHVDGHTPGFTFYIFENILFICDYVHIYRGNMILNPFGPADKTKESGVRIKGILNDRNIVTVCGFNYLMDYTEWEEKFNNLLKI